MSRVAIDEGWPSLEFVAKGDEEHVFVVGMVLACREWHSSADRKRIAELKFEENSAEVVVYAV